MNFVSYRGLELNVVQSLSWGKEPLHDQAGHTTYECSRYHGSAIFSYNPGAISYPIAGSPGQLPIPTATAGKMPVQTEVAIRNYLEQPRGQLIVKSVDINGNPFEWVRSPTDASMNQGRGGDVRNGPFVKVNSVQYVQGERLWKIHLDFETYVNEFPKTESSPYPPMIISNRWYATDDVDWQHRRTRIYQGTCTVRGDVLRLQALDDQFIDAFRAQFCAFTCDPGMQRTKVHVTITPDGNTAHYTVMDEEQLFNQNSNSPAVRVEVMDTNWMWTGSFGNTVAQAGGVTGFLGRGIGALNQIAMTGGIGGPIIGPRFWLNEAGNFLSAAKKNLPKMYKNVVVRCWGNQLMQRTQLVAYAVRVAITRMGSTSFIDTTTSEVTVSHDTNNFVQISYTTNWGQDVQASFIGGPAGTIIITAQELFTNNGIGSLASQGAFTRSINANPNTLVPNNNVNIAQNRRLVNPPFPAGQGTNGPTSGTRGTLAVNPVTLQTLLTQILEGFNQDPAMVP